MITDELLTYVKSQFKRGVTEDELRKALGSNGGWDEGDIDEAFGIINASDVRTPLNPVPEMTPSKVAQQEIKTPDGSDESKANTENSNVAENESISRQSAEQSTLTQKDYTSMDSPKKGGSKNILLSLVITLVVFGIAGGGAYAYFTYFKAEEHKLPHEVLALSFEAGKSVNSWADNTIYNIDLIIKDVSKSEDSAGDVLEDAGEDEITDDGLMPIVPRLDSLGDVSTSIDLESSTIFDGTEKDNMSFEGNLKINVDTLMGGFNVNMTMLVDVAFVDRKAYFRIPAEAPDVILFFDLAPIKEQWIEIDFSEIIELAEAEAAVNAFEDLAKENIDIEEQLIQTIIKYFSDAEVQRLIDRIFIETESVEVNGVSVYSYSVEPTKEDWREIFNRAIDILATVYMDSLSLPEGFSVGGDLNDLPDFVEEAKGQITDEMLDVFSNIELKLTIGKKDFLVRSTNMKMDYEGNIDGTDMKVSFGFDSNYSQYNKEFDIQAPGTTITIEDAMELLSEGLIKASPSPEDE